MMFPTVLHWLACLLALPSSLLKRICSFVDNGTIRPSSIKWEGERMGVWEMMPPPRRMCCHGNCLFPSPANDNVVDGNGRGTNANGRTGKRIAVPPDYSIETSGGHSSF